jgi:hypothetical protein
MEMKSTGYTVSGAPEIASEVTLRVEEDQQASCLAIVASGAKGARGSQRGALYHCSGKLIQIEILDLLKRYHRRVPVSGLLLWDSDRKMHRVKI